jgi:hypothetical protein
MSDDLKNHIRNKAHEPFNKQRTAWEARKPDFGYEIYELAMGSELINKLREVPPQFFVMEDVFTFRNYSIRQTLPSRCVFPQHNLSICGNQLQGRYGAEITLGVVPDHIAQAFKAWVAEGDAITQRCNEFIAGINKVIDAHSTLGPALKMWPALWDLLSDGAKAAHNRKVVRTKAEDATVEGVDLDALTTTVVAHKITRGS